MTMKASNAYIEFVSGSRKGTRFVLPPNREVRVGRAVGSEIQLLEDLVSRHHARIQIGASITVQDLGSRNGTFVNGRRIDRVSLESGDRVVIGGSVGQFWIPRVAESSRPQTRLTASMAGQLSEIALPDILQLLAASQKTGVIAVSSGPFEGSIEVRGGQVVAATIKQVPYEDFKAFCRILAWEDGEFALQAPPASGARPVQPLMGSMQSLLMEVMRHRDEVALMVARLGGSQSSLQAVVGAPPPLQELPRTLVRLVRSEKDCTVQSCLDQLPGPDLDIVRALAELVDGGGLHVRAAAVEAIERGGRDDSLRIDLAFSEDDEAGSNGDATAVKQSAGDRTAELVRR